MRKSLVPLDEQRNVFRGTFSHYGSKMYKGHSTPTLLLKNIYVGDKLLTDHAWFNVTKGFEALTLKPGDIVEFHARVKEYKKGYVNKKIGIDQQHYDYKFSHPTHIKVIEKKITVVKNKP